MSTKTNIVIDTDTATATLFCTELLVNNAHKRAESAMNVDSRDYLGSREEEDETWFWVLSHGCGGDASLLAAAGAAVGLGVGLDIHTYATHVT